MAELADDLRYVLNELAAALDEPEKELGESDFSGSHRIAEFPSYLELIPKEPGVYLVVAAAARRTPLFVPSTAGWFQGRDPTVEDALLRSKWVDGARILYIGKASGRTAGSTLAHRLATYVRSGRGQPVAHWGGRLLWQLKCAEECRLYWKATALGEAERLESKLIDAFQARYEKLPFANLIRGRRVEA